MTPQEAGRKGGQVTAARYGRGHMAEIGRRGFAAMVARYWGGNRAAAVRRLAEMGRMAIDPAPWNGAWYHPRRPGEPW